MSSITTINPATGQPIETIETHGQNQVLKILDKADQAYHQFKSTSFEQRTAWMMEAASVLINKKDQFAKTMTLEMGKTFASAVAEVEKCAWVCQYYAEHAASFLADEHVVTEAKISKIAYRPLGAVLAIMPWNYPFWQVFRFAAPTLMAGNVGLLKHASNVPRCALAIQDVFTDAGFPEFCFSTLLIPSSQVESIIQHPVVKAVTLTGSGPAGSAVAAAAGRTIKKTVLELGGSDPYIILEDADMDLAVEQCVQSRLLNAGQSCIGAKRFIVMDQVYDDFVNRFVKQMSQATFGDPMSKVTMGPLARIDLRDEVHDQVLTSIEKGARLLTGGYIPDMPGAFYPPTVIDQVTPGMPAYADEIFGPVASVVKVNSEEEAIRIANDTSFGLGACVFTRNEKRGLDIATNKLEAGCCFVNAFVRSDPRLPFGGIRESGFGRELSYMGIREFVNTKTVYVAQQST